MNTEPDGVERVAMEICERVAAIGVELPAGEVGVTASIGIAYHVGSRDAVLDGDDLLAEADAAAYLAKAQGGNTIHPG